MLFGDTKKPRANHHKRDKFDLGKFILSTLYRKLVVNLITTLFY